MFAGFIDHGVWAAYVPNPVPANVPKNAMFAKRSGDGKDWYEHVHPGTNFQATSVKFTVEIRQPTETSPGMTIIKAPSVDATMLFPVNNMRIIEMLGNYSGYTADQLIDQFANKMIDLDTGLITDPPPQTVAPDSLLARVEALEKKS